MLAIGRHRDEGGCRAPGLPLKLEIATSLQA